MHGGNTKANIFVKMDENQTEDDAWSSVFNSSLLFFFSDFYTIKTFEVITDSYLDNSIIAFKSNSYSVVLTVLTGGN